MREGLAAWLAGVATLAARCAQPLLAARLFGAAAALSDAIGLTFRLPERAAYGRAMANARAASGEADFAAAWEEGHRLAVEAAVAAARALVTAPEVGATDPATASGAGQPGLTPRERDVLRLLVDGRSNQEIAAALSVERSTVMSHVAGILKKLGVGSRTAAVTRALRDGLV
jgi:DNA-binding CsgD family transcriptional regulator